MPPNATHLPSFQYPHQMHSCTIDPPSARNPPTQKGLITKQGVAVNFTGGAQGLAILAVTNAQYRDSIVFSGLIEDTKDRFLSKGYMWSSASAGSLSKKFKGDLSDLCKEYDDEKSKNKIARLREQVGVVQQTMQSNISKALDNLESTESLEASSENLVASSEAFHRGAKKIGLERMVDVDENALLALFGLCRDYLYYHCGCMCRQRLCSQR